MAPSGPRRVRAAVKQVGPRTVVGTANPDRGAEDHYAVHFAARFDRNIEGFGVWPLAARPSTGRDRGRGNRAGAAVRFDTEGDPDVMIKVGISFVDQAGALANLEDELPADDFGFDALRARTRAAWNEELKAIQVEGGTTAEQRSSTRRCTTCCSTPTCSRTPTGVTSATTAVHRIGDPGDPMPAGTEHYANFSFWDTYRGQVQLLMLVAPDRVRDMVWSLEAIRQQGGRMPRWGLMNTYADFMNGEPAVQVFADAYCRGLVPPGAVEPLFAEAVRLTLTGAHRDPSFLKYGYVPYDVTGAGSAPRSSTPWGTSGSAWSPTDLGRIPERSALLRKSGNWRNMFDPRPGSSAPASRTGRGRPVPPRAARRLPGGQRLAVHVARPPRRGRAVLRDRRREGGDRPSRRSWTPSSYGADRHVPLITPEMQQKITAFGIAYYGNQYAPSNEHDLHAPYLYAWTSQPWKTQALARAYQGLYRATPDGLPGNDDLGTMSAWYVWGALGFYPAIAGAPVYVVGAPAFTEARIRLPEGRAFTVNAPGASLLGKYVQSGTLDGAAFSRTWFTHSAIADGGELTLQMGTAANQSWAWGPGPRPRRTASPRRRGSAARREAEPGPSGLGSPGAHPRAQAETRSRNPSTASRVVCGASNCGT